jgi:alanine racemase
MAEPLRSALLEIDLSALRHNLAEVRRLAGTRELIASIKANAYGFGVIGISQALVAAGVRKLWTGNIDEAIALREAGIDAEILLFGGPEPHCFETALRHDLQPTVFDEPGLLVLAGAATALGRRAPVWVKVDAGLVRLGIPVEQAFDFVTRLVDMPELELRGVYSHLPFGSAEGRQWASDGYQAFNALIEALQAAGIDVPVTQVWGSSGVLADMPDICNAVCVGHALFGLTPLEPEVGPAVDLRPVISALSAGILRVHETGPMQGGYGSGGNHLGATVAIGLGDGLRKATNGQAHILVGNRRVPVNAFTLEHLMIDLSDAARPELFDRAIVIGGGQAGISLDDWAEWTGATPLELMMSLSGRTPVSYRDAA